jgi:hypothetical protein
MYVPVGSPGGVGSQLKPLVPGGTTQIGVGNGCTVVLVLAL